MLSLLHVYIVADDSFDPVVARYWVRFPTESGICHLSCAYTVLQTLQRPGMCSAVYGTVHYK